MDKKRLKLLNKFNKTAVENFGDDEYFDAVESLRNLIADEGEINSIKLRDFVKKFFIYKQVIELEREYTISLLSSGWLRKNLIMLIKHKNQLQKLDEAYAELCLFHFDFYHVFGVSLTKTQNNIIEELLKKIS